MMAYRHADPRFPFLWETDAQPPARWHARGEGPVQYLADTPDGAWAEFLRHEEITEPAELALIRRALWVVELPDEPAVEPSLSRALMTGGPSSYPSCRAEARKRRTSDATRLDAPSAALLPGGARGFQVDGGLRESARRDGRVHVLFGARPEIEGWKVVESGGPPPHVLARVRHFR
jgi:hypothetical protein